MSVARWALVVAPGTALGAELRDRLPRRVDGEWDLLSDTRPAPPSGPRRSYSGVVLGPGEPFCRVHAVDPQAAARGLAALLEAASAARVVLLSSAAIRSPRPDHPGLVRETRAQSLRPGDDEARRWRDLELAVAAVTEATAVPLVTLRPAPLPLRNGDDAWSRLLRRRVAPVLAGRDPSLQLLDLDRLIEAVARALDPAVAAPGSVYHVAPSGVVPLRAGLRIAGARPVPGARLLSALGLGRNLPPLEHLRHPFTVSDESATLDLGLAPAPTSAAVAAAGRRGATTAAGGPNGTTARDWDDFGYDPDLCRRLGRTLWRFAHDRWWRVEVAGLEQVPRHGGAVLAGLHRGFMPMDAIMMLHLFLRELGRPVRFLVHPGLLKLPWSSTFITRIGGVVACQDNADRLLGRGDVVGVLPEGVRGAFAEYRHAYTVRKFGRNDFVRIALRNRVPILPFVTIGPAESMPIWRLLPWSWWKRTMSWPGFPLSPVFPFLPPLPTKWHTVFLPPLHVEADHPPEAADDPTVVRALSQVYRERIETTLAAMLARRRSIWRGSIFPLPAAAAATPPERG